MTEATLEEPMADDKPKALSVKLRMEVIEAARIVAAYRGESMTDMLSDLLVPILAKMEQEQVAKREKTRKPARKKGDKS